MDQYHKESIYKLNIYIYTYIYAFFMVLFHDIRTFSYVQILGYPHRKDYFIICTPEFVSGWNRLKYINMSIWSLLSGPYHPKLPLYSTSPLMPCFSHWISLQSRSPGGWIRVHHLSCNGHYFCTGTIIQTVHMYIIQNIWIKWILFD